MRISINFKFEQPLVLPLQYNHIIQAIILKWLSDENYQKFMHDCGYKSGNRTYKMYTFSKLQGNFTIDKNKKTITYEDSVKLEIASQDDKFFMYLVNGIMLKEQVRMGNNVVSIADIKCSREELGERVKIYTKSPIVTYTTLEVDNKKRTHYYSPFEKEFEEMIRNNLIKKFEAINGHYPDNDKISIKAVGNSKLKEKMLIYKGIVIKGWNGEFVLEGSKELINIAYNSGLGSKNSQGFGFIEKCKDINHK